MTRVGRGLIAGAALLVALAGCGGSGESAAKLPSCVTPPAGIGPDASGTLQLADAGKTVCLRAGQVLTVFLQAPPSEASWSAVHVSDRSVLQPGNSGVLTLVRGVTGAVLRGHGRGVATLSSSRSPCRPPTRAGCDAAHQWQARVVVRG